MTEQKLVWHISIDVKVTAMTMISDWKLLITLATISRHQKKSMHKQKPVTPMHRRKKDIALD